MDRKRIESRVLRWFEVVGDVGVKSQQQRSSNISLLCVIRRVFGTRFDQPLGFVKIITIILSFYFNIIYTFGSF